MMDIQSIIGLIGVMESKCIVYADVFYQLPR